MKPRTDKYYSARFKQIYGRPPSEQELTQLKVNYPYCFPKFEMEKKTGVKKRPGEAWRTYPKKYAQT